MTKKSWHIDRQHDMLNIWLIRNQQDRIVAKAYSEKMAQMILGLQNEYENGERHIQE